MRSEHVHFGAKRNTIYCDRCGQTLELHMPLRLDTAAFIMRSFAELHQWCIFKRVFADDVRYETDPPIAKASDAPCH